MLAMFFSSIWTLMFIWYDEQLCPTVCVVDPRMTRPFLGTNGTLIKIKNLVFSSIQQTKWFQAITCKVQKPQWKTGSIAIRQIKNTEADKVQIASYEIKQLIVLLEPA